MVSATRSALMAASLLVAAPALAASPESGRYVWVPAGATVVTVPNTPATQIDFPIAHVIAQQRALMDRMFADMDSLMAMPMPDPTQMIRSVMSGMPQAMLGTGVVMTSITTGSGTCSQTITYGYPGNGGQPVVKVSNTGNACDAIKSSGPITVTQPVLPAPAAPRHEKLWTVSNPPRPIHIGTPPRT